MSSQRQPSDHQQPQQGGNRASSSTGSSGSQRYVLQPATYVAGAPTTHASPGSAHGSGSSHGASASSGTSERARIIDMYGKDWRSTASGTDSQGSREVPIVYYPSGHPGASQHGAAAAAPTGSGPGRPCSAGEGPSQPRGTGPAAARAYAVQQEIDARPPITYGSESRSAEKARELQQKSVSSFVKRSAEKAKEKAKKKFFAKK
ncbi:hypothetical protein DHEL01_v211390 [Diaporthe helianthi]|uniref:Uncharacterized protein n=1 Tax=Diaporthe helianthi TaxID=158607 RepID=A0A2P5HIY3_DIAHE|nr:hypothetical protein DHEL01_v211390 [Diaporthe helianthi]